MQRKAKDKIQVDLNLQKLILLKIEPINKIVILVELKSNQGNWHIDNFMKLGVVDWLLINNDNR